MLIKSLKVPLKHILNNQIDYGPLYEVITRTNLITFNVYYFLRFYILDLFNNNKEIPKINTDFIMAIFKTITKLNTAHNRLPEQRIKIYKTIEN